MRNTPFTPRLRSRGAANPSFFGVARNGQMIDAAGRATCTNSGGVTAVAGPWGPSLALSNGAMSVPDSPLWALTGDFTLRIRVNWTSSPDTSWWQDALMGHDDGSGAGVNKWIWSYDPTHQGGATTWHINGAATTQIWSDSWTPVLGHWYDLALTHSSTLYAFYINGIPNGSVTDSTPMQVATAPLTIGTAEGSETFNGAIALAQIWSYRALSDREIAADYADPLRWLRPRRRGVPYTSSGASPIFRRTLYRRAGSRGAA